MKKQPSQLTTIDNPSTKLRKQNNANKTNHKCVQL